MKVFLSLIKLQLKDKIDMSFVKDKRTLIQKIVFSILSFLLVGGFTFLVLFLLKFIGLISAGEVGNLLIVFCAIYFILDLFGSSFDLMKSLYFAEDNKLLVTYPVTSGQLFISKIIVYYAFEVVKSMKLLVPVVYGFLLSMLTSKMTTDGGLTFISQISWVSLITIVLPLIIYTLTIVILAGLISIPLLYVYWFLNKVPVLQLIITVLLVGLFIGVCVYLIKLIPGSIILEDWIQKAAQAIKKFVNTGAYYAYPIRQLIYMSIGELVTYGLYRLNFWFIIKFLIALFALGGLFSGAYYLIKSFYFKIITKGSEFGNKESITEKRNRILPIYLTFTKKDLIISIRDANISGSYIAIYILIPILLMFIDAIYGAISVDLSGQKMVLAFNLLLILTPLLPSNAMIASLYSKEGRAAYIKKTKPVNPLLPLGSKLVFNLSLSIPSIAACCVVFADFSHVNALNVIFLFFSVLFIQYAHIFYSASLDLMNPLNEAYATDGNLHSNANENRSTVVGFLVAIIVSFLFFLLLGDSTSRHFSFESAFVKLFIASLIACASLLYLFIVKIKAFYYEK